jgi:hypothetical protein
MIKFLIFAGCCTGFWQFTEPYGNTMQSLFLFILLAACGLAVLRKQVRAVPLSVPEMVLCAVSVLSAAVSLYHGAEPSIIFSMAFLAALATIAILVRAITLEDLLDIGAWVILFLQICSLVFNSSLFVQALSITITRVGLLRFAPFHNHPNLTGFIFGAGTILLARRALVTRKPWERILFAAGAAMGCVFLIAASARASVAAISIAMVVALFREMPLKRLVTLIGTLGTALVGLLLTTPLGDSALKYLQGIFEINSHTRGVGSGGSGRTELWNQGINTLTSDPLLFAVGGGLRSSDIVNIGFSTEDSYVTIMLDSGLFAGSAIIAIYFYCLVKSTQISRRSAQARRELILLPSFFVFIMVESIFNRYLLGLGNPMSLFVLMTLLAVSVRAKSEAEMDKAPATVAAAQTTSQES